MLEPSWRRFAASAVVLVLMLTVTGPTRADDEAEAAAERQVFDGAARFFSSGALTVVYPSMPSDRRALHLHSAEQRAAFLREAHNTVVEIASDEEVTEEQLRGNLLLLGWDNRVLGGPDAPRPFGMDGEVRRVLGLGTPPEDDLIFGYPSPFNEDSNLFFFSRIDPEMDRFSVLPFVGSDWAVLRDYRIIRQGMFTKASTWPPMRNNAAEFNAQEQPVRWNQHDSEHFVLHWTEDGIEPGDADKILAARERALELISERLMPPPPGYRVNLFVYKDADQKLSRSGVPDLVHHVGRSGELHMTLRTALSSAPHEDIHLLARAVWGPCYLSTICEGLAVAHQDADSQQLGLYASMMLEHDALPGISELLDEENHRKLVKAKLGFPASGLLIAWLRSVKGLDGLSQIYGMRHATVEDLSAVLGKSPRKLQRRFERWVKSRSDEVEAEVAFRRAVEMARTRRAQDDVAGAAVSLREALEIKPDHRLTLYKLALAQLDVEDLGQAEATLGNLIELAENEDDNRFIVFGNFQLGRLRELQGRREAAVARYRIMLERPETDGSHRMAEEAIEAAQNGTTPER